jgi:hypothetical protein|tara:strand:- start:345 stop:899 length:555 start_codon:yes stop_codon:yes gene_type:complete
MPKGLTPSSQQIAISFDSLAGAGNYTEKRIDLQLNALDEEVFVVTAVKIDVELPNEINLFGAGANGSYGADVALTKQSRPNAVSNLGESTCFASQRSFIFCSEESQAGGDYAVAGVYESNNNDVPSQLEYTDIIATPDFFVGLKNLGVGAGASNIRVYGKVYGYRAKASSAVYASLVQSEVLSN